MLTFPREVMSVADLMDMKNIYRKALSELPKTDKVILVTGHTGFKGSWLSLWLHLLGAEVMGIAFDTPSLRELWSTPPFLHDGRASTLREVLVKFNPSENHGNTATLSEFELVALETFLLSLPLSENEVQEIFD